MYTWPRYCHLYHRQSSDSQNSKTQRLLFSPTPQAWKMCVSMFVCVKHIKNCKVNPFELAARLATGWINIHVRGNWYTPFSARRASRGKNSSYTMDRDGLLLKLSEMWASSSLQSVPWTDHSPQLTHWLKHTHSLFFPSELITTHISRPFFLQINKH